MDLELGGRTVMITGGSGAIGRVIARSFAQEGAQVAIAARTPERLEEAAQEISRETGAAVLTVPTDVTDSTSVRRSVDGVVQRFGRIDILVNCLAHAVGRARGANVEYPDDDLLLEFDVKAVGYFRCMQAVVPHMRERRWGRIINIGGGAGRHPGQVSVGMRNAGVAVATKNVSDEVGRDGITVNAIHPGGVFTTRNRGRIEEHARQENISLEEAEAQLHSSIPIGRITRPEEIAALTLFLSSPNAAAITGESIHIDGGAFRGISF